MNVCKYVAFIQPEPSTKCWNFLVSCPNVPHLKMFSQSGPISAGIQPQYTLPATKSETKGVFALVVLDLRINLEGFHDAQKQKQLILQN